MQNERLPGWPIAALAATLYLTAATRANAQSDGERDTARAAADAGRAAYDAGRHDEAIRLFSAAESIVHAPPHLLYLARAHESLGRLSSALAIYRKLVHEPLPDEAPSAFAEAQRSGAQELEALTPRVPLIEIRVQGGGQAVRVAVDGNPVEVSALTSPLPVDPGTRVIEASAEGWTLERSSVTLSEGQKQTVALTLSSKVSAPVVPEAPPPVLQKPPPAAELDRGTSAQPSGTDWMRIGGYAALGLGAVGATVAVFSGIAYYRTGQDADAIVDNCTADASCTLSEMKAVSRLDARAANYGTWAWAAGTVGALGVGSGIALLALDRREEGWLTLAQRRAHVLPWIGLAAAGVSGRF